MRTPATVIRRAPPVKAVPPFYQQRWRPWRIRLGNIVLAMLRRFAPPTRWWDRLYAWVLFFKCHGRAPSCSRSRINDILYFIKTTDEIDRPIRALISDKEFLRNYVSAKIGSSYNVPSIAVLRSAGETRAFDYPGDCVIKPTNSYEQLVFRRNGGAIDFATIKRWFEEDPYLRSRQRNYRTLERKVIVEPLVFGTDNPSDFKVMCYLGEPRVIMVVSGRLSQKTVTCYTPEWGLLPFTINVTAGRRSPIARPGNLPEMLSVCRALSRDFNLVRIDLYSDGRTVYVGEITNCHANAGCQFVPPEAEDLFTFLVFGECPTRWDKIRQGQRTSAENSCREVHQSEGSLL